ncbi:MAG: DUF1887 family protein [Clostridia bacterium]|nr:DUF1887 family protein [Clostridia bacterium]
MTYVEFFDKDATENICACLAYSPNKIIYVGDSDEQMTKSIDNYKQVFARRAPKMEFIKKVVEKDNLDSAITVLSQIIEENEECVFDITGGAEILAVALGIVYAKYPDKKIRLRRFNVNESTVCDCTPDGKTVYQVVPKFSISENVRIYGGKVMFGRIDQHKTYLWNLMPDFLRDAELIWGICRGNPRLWNTQIGVFEAMEEVGRVNGSTLTTVASRRALDPYLKRHKARYRKINGIINQLLANGLITRFEEKDEETVTVSYKNEQVKKCLTTAGMALELKVYITAKLLKDKNGNPYFDDALNGVLIDWDGFAHDEKREEIFDTENEIDVMLMRGITPIFISCKNGNITSEELYKLDTVAKRFGGKHAKRVLVAPSIETLGDTGEYLIQRAKDMNILLIKDILGASDGDEKLKNGLMSIVKDSDGIN